MISIKDKGDGWKVYADWYGQERVIFTGYEHDPFVGLRDCLSYVREIEQKENPLTKFRLTIVSSFTHDVWQGEYLSSAEGEILLDEIFRYFNRVDEEDDLRLARIGFKQPSMSAGDVVGIECPDDDQFLPKMFVCGRRGWTEIRSGMGVR